MNTAKEMRKTTKMFTFPQELEDGVKENAKSGFDFYVYCPNRPLTTEQISALKILGYEVVGGYDAIGLITYVISWKE